MFDFGLSYGHMLVLGIVAFMLIGQKDMPVVLRKVGQFMNKVRGMAREFQGQVDVAMKEAGVAGIKNDLQNMRSVVTTGVAMPGSFNQSTSSSPVGIPQLKPNDFEKFFGSNDVVGETRVGGRSLEDVMATHK